MQKVEFKEEGKIPLKNYIATLSVVTIPFLGLIVAIISLWGWGVGSVDVVLMLVLYLLTVLGITVGFHRLFTHRSFEASKFIQGLFAILGSMAIQGSLIKWVAMHRLHHQYSDTVNDPHTPYAYGQNWFGIIRGTWHSHIGWFFTPDPPGLSNYTKDLERSRMLVALSNLFPIWIIISLMIPTLIGGFIASSWEGALTGFIWGGLVRVFLVHHVTWSINSICHLWGENCAETSKDKSRNNVLFGILALGEGWHNNHHKFPTSARHGLKWWQVDLSYYVIWILEKLNLVHRVRLPY